jgi:hypothetical protein
MKTSHQEQALLTQPLLKSEKKAVPYKTFAPLLTTPVCSSPINPQVFIALNFLSGRDLTQLRLLSKNFLPRIFEYHIIEPQTQKRLYSFFHNRTQHNTEQQKIIIDLSTYNQSSTPYKMISDLCGNSRLSKEKRRLIVFRYSLQISPVFVGIGALCLSFIPLSSNQALGHWMEQNNELLIAPYLLFVTMATLTLCVLTMRHVNKKLRSITQMHLNRNLQQLKHTATKIEQCELNLQYLITEPQDTRQNNSSEKVQMKPEIKITVMR